MMAASSARINFKVKAFVDRPGVMRKIRGWKLGQLGRVGAYARGAMKKQIKPALKGRGKKDRTVSVVPQPGDFPASWRGPTPQVVDCLVADKVVLDVRNNRPVPRAIARRARLQIALLRVGQGVGRPPRRGPTDKLRRHIYFSIDVQKESVVIGPEPFPRQPKMVSRVSVPELLNKGGIEIIMGYRAKFGPRPYVETILKPALKKLKENIRKRPVN